MKFSNYALTIVFTCALLSCGDSSKDKTYDFFNIQPGMVTPFSSTITGTSFDVSFGGTTYNPTTHHDDYHYAIIISNVNNTNNVGIAFGYDPKSNRRFKVFIYYSGNLSSGNKSGTVTVIENGVKYTNTSASIKIASISGPTDNVYTINFLESIPVHDDKGNEKYLSFSNNPDNPDNPDIKAYLVQ